MTLAETLQSLADLKGMSSLAFELGFEPLWHRVSLAALQWVEEDEARAVVAGRRDGILLLGVMAPGPAERTARRLAVELTRRGRLALVAVLEPARRRLALSPAAADCPVLVVPLDRVRRIDLEILGRGRDFASGPPLARLLDWAEALSGRSLDDRFFRQFRVTLDAAAQALPRRIPRRDRHSLALLDLTRVLFLYFVQARGWLDGRPRFLREELDRVLTDGGGVERRFLAPLFFGTLNRPVAARTERSRRFGRIPFLNGGLFEAHPLERRWPDPLPDPIWRDAFDALFERYHFTVSADRDVGAIGPDMLGRVFEGVMDPEERRDTGAFYTPAALVDAIVERSLTAWIATTGQRYTPAITADDDSADALLRRPTPDVLDRIRRITILDPAVGSGAFLLGALRRLVAIRVAGGESRGAATRAVISTNLFGVDLNPNAVHLAELRLWLEVIDADPAADPETIAPLPNLDALIRQGDSVLERLDLPFVAGGRQDELATLRAAVVTATGAAKRAAGAALRRAELRSTRTAIETAQASVESRIREIVSASRSRSLFGDRMPLGRADRAALARLRRERRRLVAAGRRLANSAALPWFHYASQFADVIGRGGFDLILGNPPWVRAESLGPAEREALKRRFRWYRATGGGRPGFASLPDLAVAFLERGFELLHPDGVLGYLVPAKLTTTQWGATAREALARRSTLHLAANLETDVHGFDAVVYPLALVVGRRGPEPGHEVSVGWRPSGAAGPAPSVPQRTLGGGPWDLRPGGAPGPAVVADRHPTIAGSFRIRLGVKTGADSIFLDPPDAIDDSLVRRALRGRDIAPFLVRPRNRILWTHDDRGLPLATLPPEAMAVLGPALRRLRARADYRDGPPWTLFRTEAATTRFRVVWSDLGRSIRAAALIGPEHRDLVPLNTCYFIGTSSAPVALALAAWLNAEPIRRLADRRATVAASGFRRFNAAVIGSLPLPEGVTTDPTLIDIARAARRTGRIDQIALDARAAALLEGSANDGSGAD